MTGNSCPDPPPAIDDFAHNLHAHTSLIYADLLPWVHPRPPTPGSPDSLSPLLDRVVTPYNAELFEQLLHDHGLTHHYPNLVRDLRGGFALGRLPLLEHTTILPNHPSVDEAPGAVREYLATELGAGRMEGPFSRDEMTRVCRGHFFCSPLIVASSDQGPGLPPKLRVCRNLSKDDPGAGVQAVNDYIDKEDFPTRFDMPWRMAELVSSTSLPQSLNPSSLPFSSFLAATARRDAAPSGVKAGASSAPRSFVLAATAR